ncbi:MAG: phosphotriesterase [Bacteroidia bacterium]|nr:phosphotriesterase [Bacteroidia bacterium]
MTVNGLISSSSAGSFLTHEHVLVDFIGADSIHSERWDRKEVIQKMLPFLLEAKESGCNIFVDCTPGYLGRDVLLLQELSELSGVNIITNTGFYGAVDNKYIPAFAFDETAEQLAERWVEEWNNGIDETGIKPGFIKIGVNGGNLSEMHAKLISAAAKAHLQTGLVIASHTGPAVPAFEQIGVLEKEGVSPDAFIWVHAQAENDSEKRIEAARKGAWVSLDGLSDENVSDYVRMIKELKNAGFLHKVLLSHDAGWYDPAQPEGGQARGFTTLFKKLVPALLDSGFTHEETRLLLEENPAKAFEIKIRHKRTIN